MVISKKMEKFLIEFCAIAIMIGVFVGFGLVVGQVLQQLKIKKKGSEVSPAVLLNEDKDTTRK